MDRPKMFQVVPTDEYTVYIFYDNGEIRIFDCKWMLKKTGMYEKIHNVEAFKTRCTIMNGTLAWDLSERRDPTNCIDLCPDTVYQDSLRTHYDISA